MTEPSVETAEGRWNLVREMAKVAGIKLAQADAALEVAEAALDARDATLAEARAAEREQCAKIAEWHIDPWQPKHPETVAKIRLQACNDTARTIAAAIRYGGVAVVMELE